MTSVQNDDLAPEVREALRKEAKEENAFGDPQRLLDALNDELAPLPTSEQEN